MWEQQGQHIACIQDPADVTLYTKTGSLVKGGVELPTYRCACCFSRSTAHIAKVYSGSVYVLNVSCSSMYNILLYYLCQGGNVLSGVRL